MRITPIFLVAAALTLHSGHAPAGQIFKCVDSKGGISYQQFPCPDGSRQNDVAIRDDTSTPAPASPDNPRPAMIVQHQTGDAMSNYATSRQDAIARPTRDQTRLPILPMTNNADASYECRLPNGEVFYRHDGCPRTASTGSSMTTDSIRGTYTTSSNDVAVTSRRISREEACKKMNSAGAIGREGRGRDQQVSTYDKNLGRDPCR